MDESTTILPSSTGNHTSFSGKYRDAIFSGKMIRYLNRDDHRSVDAVQSYVLNADGYRSPEFINNVDLLFAGCSFTYGMGVPEETIWGSVIANRLGLSYNNLSLNGASIPWIVKQLFSYFKEYGNPKTLICLFPQLERTFFPSDPELLKSKDSHIELSTIDSDNSRSIFNVDLSNLRQASFRPNYSKKPHNLEDVISTDFLVYLSIQNIRMLEQYCKSSGIEFLWGTWSNSFCNLMEDEGGLLDNYEFDNYVKLDYKMWKNRKRTDDPDIYWETEEARINCKSKHSNNLCECRSTCHLDLLDIYGDNFERATDILKKHPHYGVHRHVHFAESFMKAMKKKQS
jgi:hypothetical protein